MRKDCLCNPQVRSTTRPPPFHEDPADQIIVATAREENATVMTKDKLIQE